jgi:hypothetical protein
MGASSNAMMLPGNSSSICAEVRLGWMMLTVGTRFASVSLSNSAPARVRDTTVIPAMMTNAKPKIPNSNHGPRPGGDRGAACALGTPNSAPGGALEAAGAMPDCVSVFILPCSYS